MGCGANGSNVANWHVYRIARYQDVKVIIVLYIFDISGRRKVPFSLNATGSCPSKGAWSMHDRLKIAGSKTSYGRF
jgi:hypothetical protein